MDTKRRRLELSNRYVPSSLRLNVRQHPLKVKPEGNLILIDDAQKKQISQSMGPFFKVLPDELILQIIGLLDTPQDLVSLMHTSRYFYGMVSFEEIWRNLYMKGTAEHTIPQLTRWLGSWKRSILRLEGLDPDVDCSVVYSDAIFRPYQNVQINYMEIFNNVVQEQQALSRQVPRDARTMAPGGYYKGRIPRLEESTMTMEAFDTKWYNYPFILKDSANPTTRWPNWDMAHLLERFPNETFRQETVEWPLSFYDAYAQQNCDEKPLYLFDCNSKAMKYLREEYEKPPYAKEDLFQVFGDCRPDHTWLIVGPARSGSTFHKDPNSTCAWNTVMEGSKLWVMFPPDMKPPGVLTDEEESEVTSPAGLAEWVLSGFYNDSVKISDEASDEEGLSCVIGVTYPNECIFVPAGWWHLVINLEDTVAITANFVPSVRLGHVLDFFKNKPTQVSGFHPRNFNALLTRFLADNDIDPAKASMFKEYLAQSNFSHTDEDVGELQCSKIDLPIYELFLELLKQKGYTAELERGQADLAKIEKKRQPHQSEMWQDLTKNKHETFSFGFEE